MADTSTKPYLIRAIYEWCTDSGFTPYVAVAVDETVRVPQEFVKNGEIVLNVSALATSRMKIGNDAIEFQARFRSAAHEVYLPITRVVAIYARENGQGMAFDVPRPLLAAGSEAGAGGNTVEPPRERGAVLALTRASAEPLVALSSVPAPSSEAPDRPQPPIQPPTQIPSQSPHSAPNQPPDPPSVPPTLPSGPRGGERPRLTRIK